MTTRLRLSVLLSLLVIGLLTDALLGSRSAIAGDSNHLTIAEWAGYDASEFWTDFHKKYPDVQPKWELGSSDADIFASTKGLRGVDIFHPYTSWVKRYLDEGLVEEIDTSKLANWGKVPDSLKALGRCGPTVPNNLELSRLELRCPPALIGKQYFIPWDWGFSAILYNTEKVKKPIDSWEVLFDKEYEGRISMYNDGPSAVSVYCYIEKYKGHECDETNLSKEQLNSIKVAWSKQKPLSRLYWDTEDEPNQLVDAMSNGHVWVAYAWQSAYAKLMKKKTDVKFEYVNPREGRTSWVGLYGIRKGLKGTEKYSLALAFLDEKLSKETAENVVKMLYFGVANEEVMSSTFSDPLIKKVLPTSDPSVELRTNFTPELTGEQLDADGDMWTKVSAP